MVTPWPASLVLLSCTFDGAEELTFNLFPSRTFKLLSSPVRSVSFLSLPFLSPSMALGMDSLIAPISSVIRLISSSRRREEVFNIAATLSTSRRATSSCSDRLSSAFLRVAVSSDTCSMRENALSNCASMLSLSFCNCGVVGGATRGTT